MDNEQLKPIIDKALEYYFNLNTRLSYDAKVQKDMLSQNRGLIAGCTAVICFADDQDELTEYTKAKIEELNKGEAQEVRFK